MLGLLLLYFIGKKYADLSGLHQKSKWPYVIAGIAAYYATTLCFGFILGVLHEMGTINLDGVHDFVINIIALPFGLLGTYLLYNFLEKKWDRRTVLDSEELLDKDVV